ncbi:zinc-binding alcohol dehydrogenase family protein [Brachybacterium vulturis]|uniref:quinone oxidoreductase family protein n=1 Tax=Brachybacterium vulturis TaxID=2017484 RepID=UPI0037368E05
MRIATIDADTGRAVIEERPAPRNAATVLAASINPIDLIVATGNFPLRSFSPGDALGYGGVAERADGTRAYFYDPHPPAGSLSEQVDLDAARTIDLPAGLDPQLGAVLGVPGIAAYSATFSEGKVTAGETVLVTGAAGSVGMIAGQAALARGARAVGLVVDERQRQAVEAVGMVPLLLDAQEEDVPGAMGRVAPDGVDVVVDSLWGDHPDRFVPALNHRARWVQVGSSAGNAASITAPLFRNKRISFIGHTNFLLTAQEAAEAYRGIAELTAQGKITLSFESITLDEVPDIFSGLADKSRKGKFVVAF